MKSLPAFLFLLLLSLFSVAQTSDKWTLEKCISYALENNLQIQQSKLTATMSSKDDLQSRLNLLPTIDANASLTNYFGNGLSPQTYSFAEGNSQSLQGILQANWPIFTGLQQIFNIEKARYDLLATKFDYQNACNNISLSVASSYLQVLLNKEIEKVAEKQRELTADQRETVLSRIKAGALPETSIYDIESQLGRDEASIVNAQNTVDLSILSLEQLLQLKARENFDIASPEVNADNVTDIASLSAQPIYDFAVKTQPVILSAEARVKSANATRKMTIGTISPTITAFGSLSTGYFSSDNKKVSGTGADTIAGFVTVNGSNYPFNTNYAIPVPIYTNNSFVDQLSSNFRKAIGLTLDIPLFNKGQKVLNIQKSKLQMQITELQLEGARNQLRQDIEQAYANAKAGAQSYLANKKSLEASQKAYQATETRYKAGIASNFDIQQAKNNLVAAESGMIQAKYTYVFRLKILDFYQGKTITLN